MALKVNNSKDYNFEKGNDFLFKLAGSENIGNASYILIEVGSEHILLNSFKVKAACNGLSFSFYNDVSYVSSPVPLVEVHGIHKNFIPHTIFGSKVSYALINTSTESSQISFASSITFPFFPKRERFPWYRVEADLLMDNKFMLKSGKKYILKILNDTGASLTFDGLLELSKGV